MMNDFTVRYGPWALVTGASSGIGREFARQLAARGLNVVLIARRAERLVELATELNARHNVQARPVPVDLSTEGCLDLVREATAGLEIGFLVNSAGFSLTSPYMEMAPEDMDRMLNLNCRAPMLLTREFGPGMSARRRGGIIFLTSVAGFVGTPLWSLYSGTKAFNLLLGEGLAAELRRDGVAVLSLAPGSTRTEFAEVAGIHDFMSMEVDEVVNRALGRLGRSDVFVPGWFYRGGIFATRFLPRSFNRAVFGHVISGVRRA